MTCQHLNTKVINSRPCDNGEVRRRRVCADCEERFTTVEVRINTGFGDKREIIHEALRRHIGISDDLFSIVLKVKEMIGELKRGDQE